MNVDHPTQPVEEFVRHCLGEAEEFARQDPAKALAVAFGTGVLLNLIPTRVVVGTVTAVAGTLLRPALISLGLLKAFELCCSKPEPNIQP